MKLFVGNLSFDTTQSELERLFSSVGQVSDVFLPIDRTTGKPRGFAFVELTDAAAATAATERFNGYELNGRAMRVNEAQERRPKPFAFSEPPPPMNDAPRAFKAKGSRRNLRRRKRSLH